MSSEVDEVARCEGLTATSRDSSRHVGQAVPSLGMKERLFGALALYHDATPRLAAMNMAIDEALLENANLPIIRFYQWDHPALSFGYFGRFADVAQQKRDLVRRWTGGGMVFHGEDLTYAIVIPSSDPAFWESSTSIYEKVHRVLCNALNVSGQYAVVAGVGDPGGLTVVAGVGDPGGLTGFEAAGVTAPGYNECFANPVRADVILNGQKVAGAAQRRTQRGLLHQGSIQNVDVRNGLAERFARGLASKIDNCEIDNAIVQRAEGIARQKYGTEAWLRKR